MPNTKYAFIYILKPHKKLTKTKDNAMDTESNTHAETIMTGSTSKEGDVPLVMPTH